MKTLVNLILIVCIIFIISCQDTVEPLDQTHEMTISVKVVDQSGNLLSEAQQVTATVIKYDEGNQTILENPLKDYAPEILNRKGVGLFNTKMLVPIMVEDTKLKIDAFIDNSNSEFGLNNQQTEIISFCSDTSLTFVFQKTKVIDCSNETIEESFNFTSTKNSNDVYSSDSKNTQIYKNTTTNNINLIVNPDFNQLINYGLNVGVIYQNLTYPIADVIANPNAFTLLPDESCYLVYTYSPNNTQSYLELESILNLSIELRNNIGTNCATINYRVAIEAISIEACECPTNSSTFYYLANPSATFPTICSIQITDTIDVVFNIINSSEDCELILKGQTQQPGRLDWIDANNSKTYNNEINLISIKGDVNGADRPDYFSLDPQEKTVELKLEINATAFPSGYYDLTAKYSSELRNVETGAIQKCQTNYYVNIKFKISNGECEILYNNIAPRSNNLFITVAGSNTFTDFNSCLDRVTGNSERIIYIQNNSTECAMQVNLHLEDDKIAATGNFSRQGIFYFNYNNNSSRDIEVVIEPGKFARIPVVFAPKFADAFPNGRLSTVEYDQFISNLLITTEYASVKCEEDIILVGNVNFVDCCQDNDKALREYGLVDPITNTTYRNGISLNINSDLNTSLESATSADPDTDFGIYVKSIVANVDPSKRDPANSANIAPFQANIFGNDYVKLTKLCNLVENGTGNCAGTFDWATASFNEICDFRDGVIDEYLTSFDAGSMPTLSSGEITIHPGDLYLIYLIFEGTDNNGNPINLEIYGLMYVNKISEVSDGVGNIVRTVDLKFAYPIN